MQGKRVGFERRVVPWVLVTPRLAVTLVFFVWPALRTLFQAVLVEDAFGLSREFVWLENFEALFRDPGYLASLKVTVVFSVCTTVLSMSVSLVLAAMADRVIRGAMVYRTLLIWPYADEPLSNLDAKLRVQMRVEIKKLQRDLGVTSVYVTHDQIEAMTLADRLVVMNAGRAEQIGTPLEVYEHPATCFVAGFIGSPAMNFLPGAVDTGGGSVTRSGGVRLALDAARPGQAGRKVTLGIRPEHLGLEPRDGADQLRVHVELVEPLGADTLVHGSIDGTLIIARLPGHAPFPVGEPVALWVEPGRIALFDADDGHSLREPAP